MTTISNKILWKNKFQVTFLQRKEDSHKSLHKKEIRNLLKTAGHNLSTKPSQIHNFFYINK